MAELGYEQSFTLIDTKLALGYGTVAIAGILFYMDKKLPFKDTYYCIVVCVVLYAIISAILYYYTSGPEKNNKYVGYNDGKQKIAVHTWTSKYDPIYNVKIVLNDNIESAILVDIPFTKFYDAFGFYNQGAFTELITKAMEKKSE